MTCKKCGEEEFNVGTYQVYAGKMLFRLHNTKCTILFCGNCGKLNGEIEETKVNKKQKKQQSPMGIPEMNGNDYSKTVLQEPVKRDTRASKKRKK